MIENTTKSATTGESKNFCWESLFRSQTHYLVVSVVVSLCTTTYFFHLPTEALVAIAQESTYVNFFTNLPATKLPSWAKGIDVDVWSAYYVAQFSTGLVHFLLGVIGSFFLPIDKYKSYVKDISWPLMAISQLCFLSVLTIVSFSSRIAEGYPVQINYWKTNSILPSLALTWLFATLIFYGCGMSFSALIHKFRFRKNF